MIQEVFSQNRELRCPIYERSGATPTYTKGTGCIAPNGNRTAAHSIVDCRAVQPRSCVHGQQLCGAVQICAVYNSCNLSTMEFCTNLRAKKRGEEAPAKESLHPSADIGAQKRGESESKGADEVVDPLGLAERTIAILERNSGSGAALAVTTGVPQRCDTTIRCGGTI